jgi:hypothetical protein
VRAAAVALLLAAHLVCAQAADCPAPADVAQAHLLGTWQATVDGFASPVTITLAKHPEFAGTVRGHLERGGQRIELAGRCRRR